MNNTHRTVKNVRSIITKHSNVYIPGHKHLHMDTIYSTSLYNLVSQRIGNMTIPSATQIKKSLPIGTCSK